MSLTLQRLAARIQNAGLGTVGTDLFYGPLAKIPDVDVPVTLLTQYGAAPGILTHDAKRVRAPRVQVFVKGANYDTVHARAQAIFDLFDRITNEPPILRVEPVQSEPFSLGPSSADDRAQVVCNYEVHTT